MKENSYVLISPVRNEEKDIEKTIISVVAQTVKPKKWVIVSDSSNDMTVDIITSYASKHDFIELLELNGESQRDFSSKVKAIEAGLEKVNGIDFDFIGFLDGDVSFDNNYYDLIVSRMSSNPKLGIAGGVVYDVGRSGLDSTRMSNLGHVAGAVQLFRLECFGDIGGYIPMKCGGIDTVAETMARMDGWETESFVDVKVLHHRPTGTQGFSLLQAKFRQGGRCYSLGYHPIYLVTMCAKRALKRPFVVGSLYLLAGYLKGVVVRDDRAVPEEFVRFVRREQLQVVTNYCGGRLLSK